MSSNLSALIETINRYRVLMDIATALVVIGLIGEYRKFFLRFWKAAKSGNPKAAYRMFLLLAVVVGVAGELWVNLQVSQAENIWESAQLPRDLNEEQLKAILESVEKFPGVKFDLAMHQDLEPMRLLGKIEQVFLLAKWQETPPPPGIPTFNRGPGTMPVAIRTNAGVWVIYATRSGEPLKSAATALADALQAAGIITALDFDPSDDPYAVDKISIWVGAKP
jgi:hypothetical protein